MFQVLVKTSPHMRGSYSFTVEDISQARAFVQRPDVWWYHFPLEDDWGWRRGGAWAGAEHIAEAAGVKAEGPAPAEAYPLPAVLEGDDDDEDDRW